MSEQNTEEESGRLHFLSCSWRWNLHSRQEASACWISLAHVPQPPQSQAPIESTHTSEYISQTHVYLNQVKGGQSLF